MGFWKIVFYYLFIFKVLVFILSMTHDEKFDGQLEMRCQSHNLVNGTYVLCSEIGAERYDNGLSCGCHCDTHWFKLLEDSRERSW